MQALHGYSASQIGLHNPAEPTLKLRWLCGGLLTGIESHLEHDKNDTFYKRSFISTVKNKRILYITTVEMP